MLLHLQQTTKLYQTLLKPIQRLNKITLTASEICQAKRLTQLRKKLTLIEKLMIPQEVELFKKLRLTRQSQILMLPKLRIQLSMVLLKQMQLELKQLRVDKMLH